MEVSFAVAFFSGIISFFAPCVIPLLPAYLSFITGISVKELLAQQQVKFIRRRVLMTSLVYTLGFSIVFVVMGTTAAHLGTQLRQHMDILQVISGVLIMIFALGLLDIISLPTVLTPIKMPMWIEKTTYIKAFFLGLIFATIWTPCVGAVLGAILTLAALSSTALQGAGLLFVFSIGISIPFVILSLTIAHSLQFLKKIQPLLPVISKISGLLLLLLGLLLLNNTLKIGPTFFTYNYLNGWLFQLAYKLGYQIYF